MSPVRSRSPAPSFRVILQGRSARPSPLAISGAQRPANLENIQHLSLCPLCLMLKGQLESQHSPFAPFCLLFAAAVNLSRPRSIRVGATHPFELLRFRRKSRIVISITNSRDARPLP